MVPFKLSTLLQLISFFKELCKKKTKCPVLLLVLPPGVRKQTHLAQNHKYKRTHRLINIKLYINIYICDKTFQYSGIHFSREGQVQNITP